YIFFFVDTHQSASLTMYLKYGFLGFQSRGFVETNYYHRYIKLRIYPEDFLKTEYFTRPY
ncbi:MAG: hypothetical protein RMX50_07440, partial [Planktomarina sp.]|nr:hypothetical protein [Planktomarina sp.]